VNDRYIDYYETLEVSPSAQPETIHRVYRLLAQLYHPDNSQTGNAGRFSQVLEAYKVLSDPEKRAAYDIEHQTIRTTRWRIFDQADAIQGIAGEKRKRLGILTLLYTRRMNEPDTPAMNVLEMEQLLGCPREHLELSLWYLKDTGRIQRTDNGRYSITSKGIDLVEDNAEIVQHRMLPAPASEGLRASA
jgi:curved DNA-binding protein CbpA